MILNPSFYPRDTPNDNHMYCSDCMRQTRLARPQAVDMVSNGGPMVAFVVQLACMHSH